MKTEKGVFLIIMAVLLIVLIAVGGLALDLGRLFVLRAEMQNAADSAALSAAMELRGDPQAWDRAEAAARNSVRHNSNFAEVSDLLQDIRLEFFCAIGSRFDPEPAEILDFCTNPYSDGRSVAAFSREARYVRVIMEPAENSQAYTMPLFFMPVLNAMTGGNLSRSTLTASATAGRHFYMCDFPQMMICNPFENQTSEFSAIVSPGEQLTLRYDGSWTPGNFGFLQPETGPGASQLTRYLADESLSECSIPVFTTHTGSMPNGTSAAFNTRFDSYTNPNPFNRADAPYNWPPAPNIIDYPRDQTWRAEDDRFGLGDWDRDIYFDLYHDWHGTYPRPAGWQDMTRWEVYNWELEHDRLPVKDPARAGDPEYEDFPDDGIPTESHLNPDDETRPLSIPQRRQLHVGVINCATRSMSGNTTFTMYPPEGFARIFLTERAIGQPNVTLLAEYISWTDAADEEYHVDVQLYE